MIYAGEQMDARETSPSEQPLASNRRRMYAVAVGLLAMVALMLGLVMYGADRLAFRQQVVGTWQSAAEQGQPGAPRITVEFFDNSTYRWATTEANNAEVIDRGQYRIVGTNQITLVPSAQAGQPRSTSATTTYTAQVLADQLTLSNGQHTITLVTAAE